MADKLYQQIAAALSTQIAHGIYQPGDKIPSLRKVGSQHGVSLATAQAAYHLLESRHIIESIPQSGYYVSKHVATAAHEPDMDKDLSLPTSVSVLANITRIFQRCEQPGIINLGMATPAPEYLPCRRLQKILVNLARERIDDVVVAQFPPGYELLRREIAKNMTQSGCAVPYNGIVITHGCQEALTLSLSAVAKRGDTIAIETPTFVGLLHAIETMGMKALEIPTHPQDGISLNALELALEQWSIKACALIPSFNNPLGSHMPIERREQLMDLLKKYDVPLIEDDLFGDLAHDGQRTPACKSFDSDGRVLYCSSVSKSIAPGLRVGWVAPGRYLSKIESLKSSANYSDTSISQMAVAELMASGGYSRHIRKIQREYSLQMQHISSLINRYFPSGTTITRPQGGYILWVGLDPRVDTLKVHQAAIEKGIGVVPGSLFSASGRYSNHIRINCALPRDQRIESAFETLGELISEQLAATV